VSTLPALTNPSRREFLKTSATGSAGLLLAFCLPAIASAADSPEQVFQPNAYIFINPQGDVRLVVTRSEMGQGVRTALAMILAEELDADWSRVKIEQGACDPQYGDMTTGGSMSIRSTWDPLRKAGASARDMLLTAAAETWNVSKDECSATGGSVIEHKKTARKITYGQLAIKAASVPVPKDVPLKDPKDYRIVGTKRARVDGQHIVIGEAHYGIDTKVPGMLYAVVARPPVFGGKVKKFDAARALAVPGVKKVFEVPAVEMPPLFGEDRKPDSGHQHYLWGGVAVVADSTWQAIAGRRVLTIDWDNGPGAEESTEKQRATLTELLKTPGKELKKVGDPDSAAASAAKTVEADYETPFLAHMTMEPVNCTASVRDGKCEVWAPTQNPQAVQETVAKAVGISKENVVCHVTLLGGAFGRKSFPDFVVEAAVLSKKTGKPVKVVWSREDDIKADSFHSVAAMYFKASLGADGRPTAWLQRSVFPPIGSQDDVAAKYGSFELDMGWNDVPFDIPNLRCENGEAEAHTRIGWFRSVSNIPHGFAVQSFAAELAHAMGRDPKEVLLELIGPPRIVDPRKSQNVEAFPNYGDPFETYPIDTARLRRAVELVADKAEWGRKLPPRHGQGIAVHRSFLSYVATVVEVAVDEKGGLSVPRVDTAIDCGFAANPERIYSQIEGAAVMGLSLARYGEISFKNGRVEQSNFDGFQVIRIDESPPITHVHIVPNGIDVPSSGVGEPGVPPFAPALCNAIFAATGKRIRRLPIGDQLAT